MLTDKGSRLMVRSKGHQPRSGIGSKRTTSLPLKEVRAPNMAGRELDGLNLLLQTDITFTCPTGAVRPFSLLPRP